MMDNPSTFQVGAWAIPDKRGLGVAHRIATLHGAPPANPDVSVPFRFLSRSDLRNWDSSCGQIVRSVVTHSVALAFTPAMMGCTECWAIMEAETAA